MLETASHDASLLEIRRLLGSANLFRILGTESRERWHSAFLAWVLDPNGSHGLGDFPLRRFLTLLAVEEGGEIRLPGALLGFGPENLAIDSMTGAHANVARVGDGVPLADVLDGTFAISVAAPGPQTDFCEVTARGAVVDAQSGESGAERSRFDVLIVAHRVASPELTRSVEQGNRSTAAPDVVVLVVEVEVDARFDAEQLDRYSRWLHGAPVPAGIVGTSIAAAAFTSAYSDLLAAAMVRKREIGLPLRVFGVGAFLGKSRVVAEAQRLKMTKEFWACVDFDRVARHVMEPMLQHAHVGASARNMLDEYLLLIGAQTEGSLMENVSSHYRELARQFVARNADMLRVLVKVLEEPESIAASMPHAGPIAAELDDVSEQVATSRREIFSPEHLLAANYIELGDRFLHTPVNVREGGKPFEDQLVAIVDGGAKRSFLLLEGPDAALHLVGTKQYSATGLLKEIYTHFGRKYAGSGNEGWIHQRSGKTLAQLYNDFVVERG